MNVSKIQAVGLLVALGFAKAEEWDDAKLTERVSQIPDKVKPEAVPEEFKAFYDSVVKAAQNKNEIRLVTKDEAPAAEESKKPSKSVDLQALDLAGLKSFAEENGLEIKPAQMKTETLLRDAIAKALKNPKRSKTDRAIDAAAKKGKETKTTKAAATEGKKAKPVKDAKPKAPKEDSGYAKILKAVTKSWQSPEAIAKASGVDLKQAQRRLHRAIRKGLVEVQRSVTYRLVGK